MTDNQKKHVRESIRKKHTFFESVWLLKIISKIIEELDKREHEWNNVKSVSRNKKLKKEVTV